MSKDDNHIDINFKGYYENDIMNQKPKTKTFFSFILKFFKNKKSDWEEWDYVALNFKGYANKSRTTHIKLSPPTPLPNNNIKIEIYETKR
jgi:hypothetical protein